MVRPNIKGNGSHPTDVHVGLRIRMRRMMLNISQETLGDKLGVSFQQVQKYEKGKNRVGASRIQEISHILKVPVSFFFEGLDKTDVQVGNLHPIADITAFLSSPGGIALTTAFMKIESGQLRRSIVSLVEQIAADAAVSINIVGAVVRPAKAG